MELSDQTLDEGHGPSTKANVASRKRSRKKKQRSVTMHESAVVLKRARKKENRSRELSEKLDSLTRRKKQCTEYLKIWRDDRSNWKYSKVLENWIISHSIDRKLIPKSVFRDYLVPYVKTIRGHALRRLLDACLQIKNGVEKEGMTLEERIQSIEKKANNSDSVKRKVKLLRAQYKRANCLIPICQDAEESKKDHTPDSAF